MSREWVFEYTLTMPSSGTLRVEADTEAQAVAAAAEMLNDEFVSASGISLQMPTHVTLELLPADVESILATRAMRESAEVHGSFEEYDEAVESIGRDLFMYVRDLLDGQTTLYGPTD